MTINRIQELIDLGIISPLTAEQEEKLNSMLDKENGLSFRSESFVGNDDITVFHLSRHTGINPKEEINITNLVSKPSTTGTNAFSSFNGGGTEIAPQLKALLNINGIIELRARAYAIVVTKNPATNWRPIMDDLYNALVNWLTPGKIAVELAPLLNPASSPYAPSLNEQAKQNNFGANNNRRNRN